MHTPILLASFLALGVGVSAARQSVAQSHAPRADQAAGSLRRLASLSAVDSERGYLGLRIAGDPQGEAVVVVQVVTGGPAWEQGIRAGDRILEVDGRRMQGADGLDFFESLEAGQMVHLVLSREGWRRELEARLVSGQSLGFDSAPSARAPVTIGPLPQRPTAPRAPRPPADSSQVERRGRHTAPRAQLRWPDQPYFWKQGEVPQDELRDLMRDVVQEYEDFLQEHRRRLHALVGEYEARLREAQSQAQQQQNQLRQRVRQSALPSPTPEDPRAVPELEEQRRLQRELREMRDEFDRLRQALQRLEAPAPPGAR